MQEHDVVGIGNAIVDIIGRCDEAFLAQPRLRQGQHAAGRCGGGGEALRRHGAGGGDLRRLGRQHHRRRRLVRRQGRLHRQDRATTSSAQIFGHDIRTAGVTFTTPAAAKGSEPTGRCLVLVTPDGQRTMNTFLGVSPQLGGGEVDADLVASARIVYLEGYLFDRPEAKAAFRQAAEIAAKAGRQVALSLSDPFCVDRHRAEFLDADPHSASTSCSPTRPRSPRSTRRKSFDEAARRAAGRHQARGAHALGEGQRHPGRGQVDRDSRRAGRQGGGHHGRRRPLRGGLPASASPPAATSRPPAASAAWPRPRSSATSAPGPEVSLPELARENGLLM